MNILFILQPLLFELVVTPGALAPVNLALAQETHVDTHVATGVLAESSEAPASVSSALPPETQQGPRRPAVRRNMAQAEGAMSWGAHVPLIGPGSATGVQSRERVAAWVLKPGLGPGEPRQAESCWLTWDQSAVPLPWLPGTEFCKRLRPLLIKA